MIVPENNLTATEHLFALCKQFNNSHMRALVHLLGCSSHPEEQLAAGSAGAAGTLGCQIAAATGPTVLDAVARADEGRVLAAAANQEVQQDQPQHEQQLRAAPSHQDCTEAFETQLLACGQATGQAAVNAVADACDGPSAVAESGPQPQGAHLQAAGGTHVGADEPHSEESSNAANASMQAAPAVQAEWSSASEGGEDPRKQFQ